VRHRAGERSENFFKKAEMRDADVVLLARMQLFHRPVILPDQTQNFHAFLRVAAQSVFLHAY
jgi:hypothetical protein